MGRYLFPRQARGCEPRPTPILTLELLPLSPEQSSTKILWPGNDASFTELVGRTWYKLVAKHPLKLTAALPDNKRLPFSQFLTQVRELGLLVKWSKDRNPESPNWVVFAKINTAILKKYLTSQGKWTSMGNFKEHYYDVWMITLDGEESTCKCPIFSIFLQRKIPWGEDTACPPPFPEARNLRLGQKRKRGRPVKAKRALLI